jgi:pimeloyl-ACP methyl ester carboxylesterase
VPLARCADTILHYQRHRPVTPTSRWPIVFVMGHGADAEAWRPQVEYFRRSHELVAYDHRGVGRSPRPRLPLYGVARLADDAASLLDHLGIERAHFAGISFGGVVLQQLAARHPTRVASLAIASSYARPMPGLGREAARIIGRVTWDITRTTFRGGHPLDRATDAILRTWAPANFSAAFLRDHEELVRAEIRGTLDRSRRADVVLLQLASMLAYDGRASLERISAPTWIVCGGADRFVPASLARELASGIRGAELEIWPEVGHALNVEASERFNAGLARFVERVESSAGPAPRSGRASA